MRLKNWIELVVCIALCEGAGAIGSLFTIPSISTWYASLAKPMIAPPNWVFGPVWTTLFALMGVALFLVWRKGLKRKKIRVALWFFAAQLVLNVCWSILFFGMYSPAAALIEIIWLWLAIFGTIIEFARISRTAAFLLVPYLMWVSFAAYLNLMIWWLNS